ncbi:MAG: hypothetical protein ACTJHW_04690 [Paenalcaligenes sp.]
MDIVYSSRVFPRSSLALSFWRRCVCMLLGILLSTSALGMQSALALPLVSPAEATHFSHHSPELPCADCSPEEHAALCELQACAGMMCNVHRGAISSSMLLPLNLSHDQSSLLKSVAVSAFYCPDLPPPR